jgi:hypothetical protein
VVTEAPLLRQLNDLDLILDYLERMNLHAQTKVSPKVTEMLRASGVAETHDLKPMALIPRVLQRQQLLRRELAAVRRIGVT